jgi:hypothetical protein
MDKTNCDNIICTIYQLCNNKLSLDVYDNIINFSYYTISDLIKIKICKLKNICNDIKSLKIFFNLLPPYSYLGVPKYYSASHICISNDTIQIQILICSYCGNFSNHYCRYISPNATCKCIKED